MCRRAWLWVVLPALTINYMGQGALVLHALRYTVGDAAFRRLLRTFADEYRWGRATIADFERVAERASGQLLGPFFDQWLRSTTVPPFPS